MKVFFKKMYICLFEPRKIGLFFGESLIKSILQVIMIAILALSPYVISLSIHNEIDSDSYKIIERQLIENYDDSPYEISNSYLTGNQSLAFMINEGIVYINPTDEPIEFGIEYATYNVYEFKSNRYEVSMMGIVMYSKSYADLGVVELDFDKIADADYLELDKFVSLVNKGFEQSRLSWIIVNSLVALFDILFTILISILILSFIAKVINPVIGFRFRFKAALDCQIISLLSVFLMILFNAEFIRYIGIVLSGIYLIRAMLSIVRVEVRKQNFQDKGMGE